MKKYVSLGIMLTLLSGKRYTAPELADKYETSVKTIYRAIDTLLEAGMPIRCFSGKGGGYEIINESKINSSFFTMKELSSFISFLKTNSKNALLEGNISLDERINSITDKWVASELLTESNTLVIDSSVWGSKDSNNLHIECIKKAISSSKKLLITYPSNTDNKERIIHPYTLVFKLGVWYLYAYCESRKSFRLFKLARIVNMASLSQDFERKNIDTLAMPWNKEFEENLEEIDISLITQKKHLPDLLEWLGKGAKINNYNSFSEDITITAKASFSHGLIHRLMQFGDKVKVVYPDKLKKALTNECQAICQLY